MGSLHNPTITLSAGEVSISVVESPTRRHADALQFDINMDSSNCTTRRRTRIPIDAEEECVLPSFLGQNPPLEQHKFNNHQRILDLLYVGAIVVMYPSLAQLSQLKFQNKASPFESHSVFAYMAVVAYAIAIPTSVILFSMRLDAQNITKARLSYSYLILKTTLFFSGILSPLSLVLLIIIPKGSNWIGYLLVSALFVIVVVLNFHDCNIKLLGKNNVSNLVDQIDDSTVTITSE